MMKDRKFASLCYRSHILVRPRQWHESVYNVLLMRELVNQL